MKLLSIETTTSIGSIAIVENFKVLNEIVFKSEDIAGYLVDKTKSIVDNSKIELEEIDFFVVSRGPGSWTGIRTGLSFVKGLALGKNEKIYVVSVPDSIFFILKNFKRNFLCVINAYRGNFYISEYKGRFYFKSPFPIKTVSTKEVLDILKKGDYIPVGPGLEVLFNLEEKNIFKFPLYPLASYNAFLAYEKIKKGIKSIRPIPYYGK